MKQKQSRNFGRWLEKAGAVSAIKSGLIMIIPILMIGSAALVFEYFPISQYQQFVEEALGGRLFAFFNFVYDATFGMLSIYLTCSISYSQAKRRGEDKRSFSYPLTALVCFFIFSGVGTEGMTWDALGVKGIFIAIISALLSTAFLRVAVNLNNHRKHGYAADADVEFNDAVSTFFPLAAVVMVIALLNLLITDIFNVNSIYKLFVNAANALFIPLGRSFLSALLVSMASSVLWFFGIHGSDVLEPVMENLFTPAIDINISLASAGLAPTEIFTKQFFDVFILMGGCGTTMCLLLAVFLFSKRKRNNRISKMAIVPLLFNINELMVFGYPIIYNVTLLLPFILTPMFCFLTTYASMRLGLVPLITSEVNWTAPVLLSGYMATGSIAGSVLQLVNLTAGVLIYRPFVLRYDNKCELSEHQLIDGLTQKKKDSEASLTPVTLSKLEDEYGSLARSLISDLHYAIENGDLNLFYQPQCSEDGTIIGMEALLRWKHPLYGMIYPPLVIQLAQEGDMLSQLEQNVLRRAVQDKDTMKQSAGYTGEVSVNISAETLQSAGYSQLLNELVKSGRVQTGDLCLEITEQTALTADESTFTYLNRVRELGYRLAIDDFSMGYTSLTYLQDGCFDMVKLDGSLVRGIQSNHRSLDIIRSITELSQRLGFGVIAEYVETREQVQLLKEAGCHQYQGYLFSPAVAMDDLLVLLEKNMKYIEQKEEKKL